MTYSWTPKLLRLRIIAIVVPLAFAVALGIFTEEALQSWLSARAAHIVATAILTCGVITFAFWIFGVLEKMQAQIESHRQREDSQVAEMARMAERERIGLALHDGVIQDIYGVQLRLEACLEANPGELASCIDSSSNDLTQVIGKMRQYIFGLRPYLDGDNDLTRALNDLLAAAEVNNGTTTQLSVDQAAVSGVSALEANAILELASEAIASAVSRGATQISASLSGDEHSVRLEVADNGQAVDGVRQNGRSNPDAGRETRPEITVSGSTGNNVLVASLALPR